MVVQFICAFIYRGATLFPFGYCDGDGTLWKNAFDGKKVPVHILWRGVAKNSLYATLDALVATQDLTMFSIWLWFSQPG